jgi:energy-converting hydrogenase Eha subunit A
MWGFTAVRGQDELFPDLSENRAEQGRTLDALLAAQLIGPDAPLDYRLITDAISGQPSPERWAPRHARRTPLIARLGLNAATGVIVGAVGLGGITAAAYAGVLPGVTQRIAHNLFDAPDAEKTPHRGVNPPPASSPATDTPFSSPVDASASTSAPGSPHPTPTDATPTPAQPAPAPAGTSSQPAPASSTPVWPPSKTHPTHPGKPSGTHTR